MSYILVNRVVTVSFLLCPHIINDVIKGGRINKVEICTKNVNVVCYVILKPMNEKREENVMQKPQRTATWKPHVLKAINHASCDVRQNRV